MLGLDVDSVYAFDISLDLPKKPLMVSVKPMIFLY